MKVENLDLPDIAGCEPDGWSLPLVRLRVVSKTKLSAIVFEIWVPDEQGNDAEALVILSGGGNIRTEYVTLRAGEPTQVTIPIYLEAGWDVSFMLTSDHLVLNRGSDARELSFMILAIRGVKS